MSTVGATRYRGPLISRLARLQWRVLLGRSTLDYLVLALMGCIPLVVAGVTGRAQGVPLDRSSALVATYTDYPRHDEPTTATGFHESINWLMYPVALPAGLWLIRWLMQTAVSYGPAAPASRILGTPEYFPFRIPLRRIPTDSRILATALMLNVVIHVLDMREVATRFITGRLNRPTELDWAWFDVAAQPASGSEYSAAASLALIVVAYANQFIITTMALLVPIILWRVNRAYLNCVFLRSRTQHCKRPYVVDFDDPHDRFGLGGMRDIFNRQVKATAIIGTLMLVSRYCNVRSDPTRVVLDLGQWFTKALKLEFLAFPQFPWKDLFPDIGQVLLVVGWVVTIIIVAWPARLKRLPLRLGSGGTGADQSAETYLREFTPDQSREAALLATGRDGVDALAAKFQRNHFWPNGDDQAKWLFRIALVVLALLIWPIQFSNGFWPFVMSFVLMVAAAGAAAQAIASADRARLRRVDRRLVDRP